MIIIDIITIIDIFIKINKMIVYYKNCIDFDMYLIKLKKIKGLNFWKRSKYKYFQNKSVHRSPMLSLDLKRPPKVNVLRLGL
jgi:hypothetical protein